MVVVRCLKCGEHVMANVNGAVASCKCSNLAFVSGVLHPTYGAVDMNQIEVVDIGLLVIRQRDIFYQLRRDVFRYVIRSRRKAMIFGDTLNRKQFRLVYYDKTNRRDCVRRINTHEYKLGEVPKTEKRWEGFSL